MIKINYKIRVLFFLKDVELVILLSCFDFKGCD